MDKTFYFLETISKRPNGNPVGKQFGILLFSVDLIAFEMCQKYKLSCLQLS